MSSNEIRPFRVGIPQEELDDLKRRILSTRWPTKETVSDASQGVQLSTMQALADYWATNHDWRKVEARLNSFPQFLTEINGVDIRADHSFVRLPRGLDPAVVARLSAVQIRGQVLDLQRADQAKPVRARPKR